MALAVCILSYFFSVKLLQKHRFQECQGQDYPNPRRPNQIPFPKPFPKG